MTEIDVFGIKLKLLPEKAVYIKELEILLVADLHLGKSETFQSLGIPIANEVNQETLDRLQKLCFNVKPKTLFVLGDLFHSKFALVPEVLESWNRLLKTISAEVKFIVGNHDRRLVQTLEALHINFSTEALQINNLVLSHEPFPQSDRLNICGHIHPCVRLKNKLDNLRLPCFYLENSQNLLVLPSFGEFTGGYEVSLSGSTVYIVVDDSIVPLVGYPE